MVETPTRRREGTTLDPSHALKGCETAAHMLDHPAWERVRDVTNASEIGWDQCVLSDDPTSTWTKSTIWLCSGNITYPVKVTFGVLPKCYQIHVKGTHKALRGVDDDGRYLTSFDHFIFQQ